MVGGEKGKEGTSGRHGRRPPPFPPPTAPSLAAEEASDRLSALEREHAVERQALEDRHATQNEALAAAVDAMERERLARTEAEQTLGARVEADEQWERKYQHHLTEVHEVALVSREASRA